MANHWSNSIVDDVLSPQRSKAKTSDTEDKSTHGNSLIPCGIGEFIELWIWYFLIKYLTNDTKDIDSRDNYRCAGNYGTSAMEGVCVLERSDEDVHLSDEARETWQSEVCKTGNYVSH